MKIKGKIILYLSIVMFVLSLSTVLFAEGFKDVRGVRLNDGTVIYGKVLKSNVYEVIIEKKDGKIVPVKFDDVSYFFKDEDAESYKNGEKSAYPVQSDIKQKTPAPLSTLTGGYMGVFGGYVIPQAVDRGEGNEDLPLDNSWAIGVKGGYVFPTLNWLAVELEYTYLAQQKYDKSGSYVVFDDHYAYRADGDYSAHNLMANILFRYPMWKIHPYGGVGLGISRANFASNFIELQNGLVTDSTKYDEDDTAFAGQLIAGVNFEIIPNLSADIAYKFFYSKYKPVDIDLEMKNHLITIGINYHF